MYFLFSQLVRPYTLLVVGILLAALAQWRKPTSSRYARLWLTILAVVLYVVSCPLAGTCALYSLERSSQATELRPERGDVIVVLSGSIVADHGEYRVGTDTLYRCLAAVSLYRESPGCRLIVCGGHMLPMPGSPTNAQVMKAFLVEQGVAGADIELEDRSRTTHENARETAKLLREAPAAKVFLVTDAVHMLRARHCFGAQGIGVIAHPCNRRVIQFEYTLNDFLPSARGMQSTELAIHEWLGMAWYRLRGYL